MDVPPDAEPLPPHLERWSHELLGASVPRERNATCDACVMCRPAGAAPRLEAEYFDPRVKCCTYLPVLANFLVGRILGDARPEAVAGRATVLERIARGVAVTPLGLHRPADIQLLYDQGSELFGQARSLRCPHFLEESGSCGVWRHRESSCATWFCKHARGATGRRFWKSLHELMSAVEHQVACWCVLELDVGTDALRALFPDTGERPRHQVLDAATLDRRVDPELARRQWGGWLGRESEFYAACAALTADLPWSRVLEICEPRVRALATLTRDAFAALSSDALPHALRVGRFEQVGVADEVVRVRTYSGFDPLDVPHPLMRVLRHFDGRPTVEALAGIARREGLALDPALVRRLVDFGILVPAEARP